MRVRTLMSWFVSCIATFAREEVGVSAECAPDGRVMSVAQSKDGVVCPVGAAKCVCPVGTATCVAYCRVCWDCHVCCVLPCVLRTGTCVAY